MTERSERMSEEAPGNRNVNGGSYALSLVSSSFPRFSHSCHFGWLRGSSGPLGKRKLSYVKRFKLTGDFVPLSANP